MKPVIFLWSHPRSMSTAIERVMRERGDLECLHEPFLHYYYLQKTSKQLAHFEVEQDHPVSYEETRDSILKLAESSAVFAKDMSYYVMPEILSDVEFCQSVQHCFLIRNPLKSILSYHRLDPDLTLEEVGIEAQWRHLEGVKEITGRTPVVIEAEAIQADSKGMMRLFWQATGLAYSEKALSWEAESTPEDWQYVKGWHQNVSSSQGIKPIEQGDEQEARAKFDKAAQAAPQLKQYLHHHWPFYEDLKRHSLTVNSG